MPKRTDHNEAMRLADELVKWARDYATTDYTDAMATKAATLLRQLSAERDQLRAEVERLRADAERWEYALNSEEFAVCEWGTVFGEPCWVPISEESALDAARTTHKDET